MESTRAATSVDSGGSAPRSRLSRAEWVSIGGMAAFILFLHVLGWGVLAGVVVPGDYSLGDAGVFGLGVGLTAYLLGMRHAFDADHIAAIDNTTRKLLSEGQRPVSVGFWFSLGHSSIVFGLASCWRSACGRWPGRSRANPRLCGEPPG